MAGVARCQAEADAQIAVMPRDRELQPLAVAAPAMGAIGDPAERRQAGGVEFLRRSARHLAARLDLDDTALRLVEDDEHALLVAQPRHQRDILCAGDETGLVAWLGLGPRRNTERARPSPSPVCA